MDLLFHSNSAALYAASAVMGCPVDVHVQSYQQHTKYKSERTFTKSIRHQALTHVLTYSLTRSLTHKLAQPRIPTLTYALMHSPLTRLLTYPFTHARTHFFLTHLLTHSPGGRQRVAVATICLKSSTAAPRCLRLCARTLARLSRQASVSVKAINPKSPSKLH